jgi:ATPase family associated with various cellular activities (AAA)
MQPLPSFDALERLKKFLSAIRLNHASTMAHYRSDDGRGFFHQPTDRAHASRSSTATCVASLVHAGLWTESFALWKDTQRVASKLIARPWRSAGLDVNNPFSVSFIAEGILDLQSVFPNYKEASEHLRLIRQHAVPILLNSFKRGAIKVHPYPPCAYLTQLAFRVLNRLDKITEELRTQIHRWSRNEISKQISLISAKSRNADPLNLAYALILASTTAQDEEVSPEDKHIFSHGLSTFFQSQNDDGSWPQSRPLFHYSSVGNAYCFEYELLTQLLRSRHLRNDLLPFISPYIERAAYRLESTSYDLNPERPNTAIGWPSGHHPQIEGPESWSTASVYDFAYASNALVGEAIRRVVFAELGAIYSPPTKSRFRETDDFAKDGFLDADLIQVGKPRLSLRKTIAECFVYPIAREVGVVDRGFSMKPSTPMSAILFGPPGTSKTQLARLIADYLGWPLLSVDPSFLVQEGVDRIQAQANRLFKMLTMSEEIVALLDEFDEMGRDRARNQELLSRFITTAMLPKLVSINKERKIVFLLATNYISGFDAAFRRGGRFDMLMQVMPPNTGAKLNHWPVLHSGYRRLSSENQRRARWMIADLTFLECEQLAKKLGNLTRVDEIWATLQSIYESCTLNQTVDGQTWKAICRNERLLIRIPGQ